MDIFDEKRFAEEFKRYIDLSIDGRNSMRSEWKREFEIHRRLLAATEE